MKQGGHEDTCETALLQYQLIAAYRFHMRPCVMRLHMRPCAHDQSPHAAWKLVNTAAARPWVRACVCVFVCLYHTEYGAGRLAKKHSTFFSAMMKELSLSDEPECYFDLAPWQVGGVCVCVCVRVCACTHCNPGPWEHRHQMHGMVCGDCRDWLLSEKGRCRVCVCVCMCVWTQMLAAVNHNFLLTERRRHYLRYLGGLSWFEVRVHTHTHTHAIASPVACHKARRHHSGYCCITVSCSHMHAHTQ